MSDREELERLRKIKRLRELEARQQPQPAPAVDQQPEAASQPSGGFGPMDAASLMAGSPIPALEMGAQMATGALGEVVGGVAGIAQSLNPWAEAGAGAKAVESVREALTYQPRTIGSQLASRKVGEALAPVGEAVSALESFTGDVGYEAGASGSIPPLNALNQIMSLAGYEMPKELQEVDRALGGALGRTAPTAILETLGLKGSSTLRGSKRIAGITDETADALKRSGLDIDDLSDANIQKIQKATGEEAKRQMDRIKAFQEEGVTPTRGDITQGFEQQKTESFLAEQTGEAGEQMRGLRLSQSRKLRENLDSMINDLGVPEEVGTSVKDALFGRKSALKADRKIAYDQLSEVSKSVDIPVSTKAISDSLPDMGDLRDFAATNPTQYRAVDNLLKEFGVIPSDEVVSPLSVENFERFRKRLNNIASTDISGQTSRIVSPIREALDSEMDMVTSSLVKKGSPEISEIAKEARRSHIALKTEFDQKALTDQLIASKSRGSNMPKFEDSQIYQKLSSKSTPVEQFDQVVASLKKSGNSGAKAIADIKNRMLIDIIDSAYGGGSRKIAGERTFGADAFQRKFNDLKPKLEKVFSAEEMKRLDNMSKIAESIRAPSGAVPKGSAGFFVETLNKLGMAAVMNKVPGGQLFIDRLSEVSRASKNREAFRRVLKKPEIKEVVDIVNNDYPSLAVALGISQVTDEDKE